MAGNTPTNGSTGKWLLVLVSVLLAVAFFIPWVSWDKSKLTGADMPLGNFFGTAEKNYSLTNPFPQVNFLFPALWLIPVLAFFTMLLAYFNKKSSFIPVITGILPLSIA